MENCLPKVTQLKSTEDLEKMQANGPEKVEIKTQKKFLEACVARF